MQMHVTFHLQKEQLGFAPGSLRKEVLNSLTPASELWEGAGWQGAKDGEGRSVGSAGGGGGWDCVMVC